jgi:hypothetical protein
MGQIGGFAPTKRLKSGLTLDSPHDIIRRRSRNAK